MSLRKGVKVWIEDEDLAWTEAEVIEVRDKLATVITALKKKVDVSVDKLLPRDPDVDLGGVDDMTKLTYLCEPEVLYNLARRYTLNEIYTYTGNILIAVNPFTKLPHLYNAHMMEQYRGVRFGDLSPHIFAIADASYRAMVNEAQSQSILVSGESGAGKTETTKLIMQYLTHVGGRSSIDDRSVEQQVLESNPLLEAFGNAKTIRNDNSSRFGKFVEIQFDDKGRISGAAIRTYLLERSRVVQINDPERNYHCFYQLCASGKDAEKFNLSLPSNFHYLNQSKTYELDGVSNAEEYLKTRRAMDIVGISFDDQEAIFRILAAILHLGNVEFLPGKDSDSSVIKNKSSTFHLQMAADLFMVDADHLFATLCSRSINTHEGKIIKALDCASSTANRDALSKTVYARLFDWLVDNINKSVGQDKDSRLQIGVLDIYGFECFKNNSFEQFCINFANEKLQQHFNEHVFKMEQEEYSNEEIIWSYIEFIDNQDVLDLIEKRPIGIISLLDEACMFPKSTHETFSTKLFQSLGKHQRLEKNRVSETDFTLTHYAGKVTYQTDFFLDKNRDYVITEHCKLLSSSNCHLISGLFPLLPEDSSRSSYKLTSVASRFKYQLQALMETLKTTEPHYVRCIKPNSVNLPQKFENQGVLHQLRCGGVLEAVRISLAGYPTRRTYSEFVDRFGLITPELMDGSYDDKTITKGILQKLQLENYQLGRTKVFLRVGQIAILDSRRAEILDRAAKFVQNNFRRYIVHKKFGLVKVSAITLQSYCRGYLARKIFELKKQVSAAILIQKHTRKWLFRRAYVQMYSSVVVIQSSIRSFLVRCTFKLLREHNAAKLIQAWWKMRKAYTKFNGYRHAIVSIQCAWRQKLARKELRRLHQAATETGALKDAKTKLERKLSDLNLRLTVEKRLRAVLEEKRASKITNLENEVQLLNKELNASKLDTKHEQEINVLLQKKIDALTKEKAMLDSSLNEMTEVRKENLNLQNSLKILTRRKEELEIDLQKAEKHNHETMNKLKDVEAKHTQLQQNFNSLEDKLSSFEDENHILRQNSINFLSPRNKLPLVPKTPSEKYPGGVFPQNVNQMIPYETSTPTDYRTPTRSMSESRRSKLIADKNKEIILRCVKEDLGFLDGKPVAACILYRCLLQWHAFEADRTTIFDYIVEAINNVVKVDGDNDMLPYWLSNTSALLCLLQRNLRPNGLLTTPRRSATGVSGKLTQALRSPLQIAGTQNSQSFVDAKYPAILFKQQLTASLEKIFGLLRDNLKKELSPLLSHCIQAPRSSRVSTTRTSKFPGIGIHQPLSTHWEGIVKFLDSLLVRLRNNHVPSFFIRKLITQVFSFINVQLFNSLLLRRECCTFSNGEFVKSGIALLEKWIADVTEEFAGTSWHELKYIRQAVGFLIIHQKRKKSLEEIQQDLCPALSVQQIYRICTMYWDEKYNTQTVSEEVVTAMRDLVNKDSNLMTNSFLLDDDMCIPFSTEDISKAIPVIDPMEIDVSSYIPGL